MGSGQAPEALCSWLYSSCCRAPSFSNLRPASRRRILWSLCSSCLFRAASSSHSCLRICSKGGSSSLLFFLVGCHLKSYITLCQFRGGDNRPPGRPGGSLGVSDWRTLAVQMHSEGWGKTSLEMGVCLSSPLFWPSHWWQGDGLSTFVSEHPNQHLASTSTGFLELSSQCLTSISTFVSKHLDQHLASTSTAPSGPPC